jgi:hypothetical protein
MSDSRSIFARNFLDRDEDEDRGGGGAQKEAGGGGVSMLDTYKTLGMEYDQLYQAPIGDLHRRIREWSGPIGKLETKGCSLGVLTLLGFMTREEAEQKIGHKVIETDRSFTAIMRIINPQGLNLVEMQTWPSDIPDFFRWIEHKLLDDHLTIVKFNRTDNIGHIAIFAKIGNKFYTIDPQTQKIVQRDDKKFIGWTKLAEFTSISLPMIAFNRANLLKFKITNEMINTWTCLDPKGVKAGTKDCTFNVFAFFDILSKTDARVRSYYHADGTSHEDRTRMLFERFDWNDIFKNTNQIYKDVPKDPDNFSILMNELAGVIEPGYGIPIDAQHSSGGHSFILAVTDDREICVIDPQIQKIYRGMIGVQQYFNEQDYNIFGLYYESEKDLRPRVDMFEAGIRKQNLDPVPLKKQKLKMPSDRGVVSPGLVMSPGQKKIAKMKKLVKKITKKIRDIKKDAVKGNKRERTLKMTKIKKEQTFLNKEIKRLGKGKGKSRKLGVGKFRNNSRRRK